jgi:hypothetical protein
MTAHFLPLGVCFAYWGACFDTRQAACLLRGPILLDASHPQTEKTIPVD